MENLNIRKISFTKRPIPIPAEYRPMYKISLIVLILKLCCRAETGNLLKLHLFSWVLASEKHMAQLKDYIDSGFKTDFSVWGIEPALNRALQLAVADNICEMVYGKNYKLSAKGKRFFEMIDSEKELFVKEKAFLASIGKNLITDGRITEITQKWGRHLC